MNLGHTARVKAYHRQIQKFVEETIPLINEDLSLEEMVSAINALPDLPWRHSDTRPTVITENNEIRYATDYNVISFTNKYELISNYGDITQILDRINENNKEYEIEEMCEANHVLATMAWILERNNRNQDTPENKITYEADPISIRIMAALWDEKVSRFEGQTEEDPIFDHISFRPSVERSRQANAEKAKKMLQEMIAKYGDLSFIREVYTIENSDIPDIINITIQISSGRITANCVYSDNLIKWLNAEDILIETEIPSTVMTSMPGQPLEKTLVHPFTDGLGLKVTKAYHVSSSGKIYTRIINNAWQLKNLVKLTIDMNEAENVG